MLIKNYNNFAKFVFKVNHAMNRGDNYFVSILGVTFYSQTKLREILTDAVAKTIGSIATQDIDLAIADTGLNLTAPRNTVNEVTDILCQLTERRFIYFDLVIPPVAFKLLNTNAFIYFRINKDMDASEGTSDWQWAADVLPVINAGLKYETN